MTLETLVMIAGVILSILFSYAPGLKEKYGALAPEIKRSIMLGLLVLVSAAVYGLSCAGWLSQLWPDITLTCNQSGLFSIIKLLILATIANQGTYMISPLPKTQ